MRRSSDYLPLYKRALLGPAKTVDRISPHQKAAKNLIVAKASPTLSSPGPSC